MKAVVYYRDATLLEISLNLPPPKHLLLLLPLPTPTRKTSESLLILGNTLSGQDLTVRPGNISNRVNKLDYNGTTCSKEVVSFYQFPMCRQDK